MAIFGGTGGVGRWLFAVARENGDHVKVLVRNRQRLPGDLGAIGVVEGDVRDGEAVAATIGGCDDRPSRTPNGWPAYQPLPGERSLRTRGRQQNLASRRGGFHVPNRD
ncbi:MAG: NAD(P)H-binding protein [Candidatus Eremiobacteraeota bacterium]|nr:NAD(P)H-binding protein [Candidatus Eremiobacteraeota bacterium]